MPEDDPKKNTLLGQLQEPTEQIEQAPPRLPRRVLGRSSRGRLQPWLKLGIVLLALAGSFTLGFIVAKLGGSSRKQNAVSISNPVTHPSNPGPGSGQSRANPFAGQRLYVPAHSNASRQAAAWRASRPADARVMDRLAAQPQAQWLVGENDGPEHVAKMIAPAQRSGAMPVLVLYNIPHRDCGSYSAGGAASPAAYQAWVNGIARGLGHARVALILEPDALAAIGCLSAADQQSRLGLLAQSARTLTAADPQAAVYLDAGNSAWAPASEMVQRLSAAGISEVRGFSLNVSNFNTTSAEVAYGQSILAGLGSGHGFVIDTSRNGNGPAPGTDAWCNPDGRALGHSPQAAPNLPSVDALLWIKAPGESDGTCNGGPPAGTWWPDYALGLARQAGWTG